MTALLSTTTSSPPQSAQDFKSLVEQLGQQVVMVRVKVCRWRGKIKLKGATVQHEGVELAADDVTEPQLFLLPREWEHRFERVEQALRRAIDRRTIKVRVYDQVALADGTFDEIDTIVDDANVVPRAVEPLIKEEIRDIIQRDWKPLVDQFMAALPGIVADQRAHKPQPVVDLLDRRLPQNLESLRGTFKVLYMPRPLGVSTDDLAVAALEKESGPYLMALRESIVRESIKSLQEAVDNLHDLLSRKAVVKAGSIQGVVDAISLFKSFSSAMGAEDLNSKMAQAEKLLQDQTPKDLNDDNRKGCAQASQKLLAALDQIKTGISADQILKRSGGRAQRHIDI